MNNQMTSKTAGVMTAKALMLVSVLLLAACDGGIFGTGGSDTDMAGTLDSAGLSTDDLSATDQSTTTNTTDDSGDTAGVVGSESDAESDAGSDAGTTTGDGETTPDADVNPTAVDTGGDSPTPATDAGGAATPVGGLVFDPVTGLSPGGYLDGTLTALVEANGGLSALQAFAAEGLDLALNDPNNTWTVFIPNDDAIAAATGPVDVQNHIVTTGAFNSTDITGLVGSPVTVNSGTDFEVGGGGTEPLTFGGHNFVTPDLMVGTGPVIVHIIDGVLGQ